MCSVLEMRHRISSLNVLDVQKEALTAAGESYLALQREQMFDGRYSDQSYIQPDYTRDYARWKAKKYPNLPRHVTLHLTGYFYSKFEFQVTKDGIEVTSDDQQKLGWLEGLYNRGNKSIWGIGGPYLKKFLPDLQKDTNYYVKKWLKV